MTARPATTALVMQTAARASGASAEETMYAAFMVALACGDTITSHGATRDDYLAAAALVYDSVRAALTNGAQG